MKYLIFVLLFFVNLTYSQNDTIQKTVLDEVIIESDKSLKLIPKNGKYEVSVSGTSFEDTENTWEGLKQVPLLRVIDGNSLKVTNKTAMIQINGIETHLDGQDLEDYLKSLDPKTIKRIEITSNPNASYEGDVSAVINIILSQKQDNYRLGINTTNGFHSKYYNNSNANYSINWKKIRLYTNYAYSNLPTINTSEIKQQIGSETPLSLNYKDNDLSQSQQAFVNVSLDVSKKDQIDFTAVANFNENQIGGNSFNDSFSRKIDLESESNSVHLAEVWKHNFNDSITLKVGSYQVFRNSESANMSDTNNTLENQRVKNKTPIFIGFADYTHNNSYGFSSAGFRYNNTDVQNNNFLNNQNSPFSYSEQVAAVYLNHNILFSEFTSLDLGIRSETTLLSFSYKIPTNDESYSNKNHYTNLLYTVAYNWYNPETTRASSVAFRKQIKRPNYSYLNPFQSISNDITYFSGDFSINPAKYYNVSYETNKKEWTFYFSNSLVKDFISSFYEVENERITLVYQNFETLLFSGVGTEYFKRFFNKKWTSKSTFDFSVFKLKSEKHDLEKSTPQISFSTVNILDLYKGYKLSINYSTNLPYKDGTLKHYFSQRLDFVLTKKFSKNLSGILFVYDAFKTSINGSETTVPNYFYASKYYNDTHAFGVSLRWNITGKTYKDREIEEPEGNEIDRL